MTPSIEEQKIRKGLPLVRLMQAYMPLKLTNWLIDQGVSRVELPASVTRRTVEANGVACEWIIPDGSSPNSVLLYLHGGGFVYGLSPPHLEMAAYLAQQMNARILLPHYRLAPAHPFPAPLEDCAAAYRWLLDEGVLPQQIGVAGDSAGGNLALALLLQLREAGEPLPAAAAALSPVANLADRNYPSDQIDDPLLHPRAMQGYKRSYVGQSDPHNPLISPVFADWGGLPPLLLHAGEDEVLRDDAKHVARLAEEAGGDVQLKIYPRMWHVWQINVALPEARQSLDEIAQFLQAHLKTAV